MGFYHKGEGRYRLYNDTERRAFGEQKRIEASQQWHATWVTKMRLKVHWNHTDGSIKKYLGEPEVAGHGRRGAIMAWQVKDVKAAEQNPEFQEWMAERLWKQYQRDPDTTFTGIHRDSYAGILIAKHYKYNGN